MKYSASGHKTEFLGTVKTTGGFKIKADGKAFNALVSNLYANNIGSMVRELACNAQDAHRLADRLNGTTTQCQKPFDIHLPTELEPYFFIRDYGTGLSFDQMVNVYTVIFESTKDDSNDDTGCFGLGAKTPLAYNTKTFIVYSYQNGKVTSYSAFFQENGIPDLAVQDEQDTDEPDGLKVYVTARKEDISAFHHNARIYLPFFQNPSANVLNPSFKHLPENEFLSGSNWRILSESPMNDHYVLMGPVPYPIDLWNVAVEDSKRNILDETKNLLGNLKSKGFKVEFTVPLGSVLPQLSREELSYDERTCETIFETVMDFKKELIEKIEERLAAVSEYDSYFKACIEYSNFAEKKFSFISQHNLSNPQWNGDIPVDKKEAFNGWLVRTLLNLKDIDVEYTMYKSCYSRGNYVVRHEKDTTLDIRWLWEDNVYFIFPNDCKGYKSRVRLFTSNSTNRKTIIIEKEDFDKMKSLLGITDELMNKCNPTYGSDTSWEGGKFNWIDANDLEKPTRSNSNSGYIPKEGRVTKDSLRADIVLEREDGDVVACGAEDVVIESDTDAIVVYGRKVQGIFSLVDDKAFTKENWTDSEKYENVDISNISGIFNSAIELPDDIKVIAIKGKKDNSSFRKAQKFGWIPVEDFIKDWISKNKSTIELVSEWQIIKNMSGYHPEVEKLHPLLKKFNDKKKLYVKNISEKVEEIRIHSLPRFKENVFSTTRTEKLNAIKKFIDESDAEVDKWEQVYYSTCYAKYREMIWDAFKFKIQHTYDENLNKIDLTKNIEVLSVPPESSETVENEEDTKETEAA